MDILHSSIASGHLSSADYNALLSSILHLLITVILTPTAVHEGEHHLKNENEIDEFHKSQLDLEYEVYFLNYAIKRKPQNLHSAFEVLKGF